MYHPPDKSRKELGESRIPRSHSDPPVPQSGFRLFPPSWPDGLLPIGPLHPLTTQRAG